MFNTSLFLLRKTAPLFKKPFTNITRSIATRNLTSRSWLPAKQELNVWVPTIEEMQEDRTLLDTLALVDFSSCRNPASNNYTFILEETLSIAYAKFTIFKEDAQTGNVNTHAIEMLDYSIAFLSTNILNQKTCFAQSLHEPTLTLLKEMQDFLQQHVVANLDKENQAYCKDLIAKMRRILAEHSNTLTFSR